MKRSVLEGIALQNLWKMYSTVYCNPFRAKFGTCTVVRVNRTLVENKMRRFKGECAHFRFNKCPIYIHDGAIAKFSTNLHETKYSVVAYMEVDYTVLLLFEFTSVLGS